MDDDLAAAHGRIKISVAHQVSLVKFQAPWASGSNAPQVPNFSLVFEAAHGSTHVITRFYEVFDDPGSQIA